MNDGNPLRLGVQANLFDVIPLDLQIVATRYDFLTTLLATLLCSLCGGGKLLIRSSVLFNNTVINYFYLFIVVNKNT
jgi:hypothetical protein